MADPEGYESFEVNDTDLAYAMNPGRRRKYNKHEQTYGVWADEDSDDEDSRPSFGGKKKKDYSTPVSFVSGGIKQGSGTVKVDDGASSSKVKSEDEDGAPEGPKSSGDEDVDDGDPLRISSFKRQKGRGGAGARPLGSTRKGGKGYESSFIAGIQNQMFAGMRGDHPGSKTGEKFGDWERHTKGIGMKLLEKMGYESGKGLGMQGQGIAEPVTAVLRPGRGAIGAYGKEVKGPKFGAQLKKNREGRDSPEGEESSSEEENRRVTGQWRKDGVRKKPKYRYKTIDELIDEGGSLSKRIDGFVGGDGKHSTTKVIDMTGKEKKTYTGYEMFTSRTKAPREDDEVRTRKRFDVPELSYNLTLLLEMTEDEIIRNDRQTKFLKDQNVTLQHEKEQLKSRVVNEDEERLRTQEVLQLVEQFAVKSRAKETTLEDCKEILTTLQHRYPAEYRSFGLSSIAVTDVLPLLRQTYAQWEPLKEPTRHVALMREWRRVLEGSSAPLAGGTSLLDVTAGPDRKMDPYHKMVWEAVMPAIRRAALTWQPASDDVDEGGSEPMIAAVEAYAPVMPQWIMENWLDQIVLPRIQAQVESWDPVTSTVPIHSWLHPWLPIMGDRLLPVYPGIRHKLGRALQHWHPSDPSAKLVLQPWKDVFSPGTMDGFLMQNIVPKLHECMANLVVNPADQSLDVWNWVMDWQEMLNTERIVQILMRHFFAKWLSALYTWLVSPTANFDEVSQWYSGWKSLFTDALLDAEQVKAQFTIALDMMNRAVSGQPIPRPAGVLGGPVAPPPPPPPPMHPHPGAAFARYPDTDYALRLPPPMQLNFRELVEKRAYEANLTFVPVVNKFREGKPVYQFGSKQIYIDNKVIFLLDEGVAKFFPVGLEHLVGMARI